MKLFDKYLLACTNQRIPMPKDWQGSLGLALTETKQTHAEVPAEITGYRFQQNDVLDRGYVNRQVRSMALDEEATYLLLLYLQALKEHKGVDARTYLSIGETYFSFPDYVLTVDIVKGLSYTIYGSTERPVQIRIYNTLIDEDNIYENTTNSLDRNRPIVISTQQIVDDYLKEHNVREAHMLDLDNYFEIDGLLFHYETDKVYICNYDKPIIVEGTITGYEPEIKQSISVTSSKFICNKRTYILTFDDTTVTKVERILTKEDLAAVDEYYRLEIKSAVPVTVVPGAYPYTPLHRVTNAATNATCTYDTTTHTASFTYYYGTDSYSYVLIIDSNDLPTANNSTKEYHGVNNANALCSVVLSYTSDGVKMEGYSVFIAEDEVSLTAQVAYSGSGKKYCPLKLSAAGYFSLPYSNKLIPTLLDMNITEESPVKERMLLDVLTYGDGYKEKIMLNTQGIFDVDDNIGEKLVW